MLAAMASPDPDPTAPRRRSPRATRRATLALAALLLAAPACTWTGDRLRDLSQTVHVGVGVSVVPTFFVYGVVPLFGTALGYLPDSWYVGSDYGYTAGWHHAGIGTIMGGEFVHSEFGHSPDGWLRGTNRDLHLDQSQLFLIGLAVHDYRVAREQGTITLSRFDVGVHVLVVGASLGLDVVELFDFVAGLAGFDPSGDDGVTLRRAPFEDPRALDPDERGSTL